MSVYVDNLWLRAVDIGDANRASHYARRVRDVVADPDGGPVSADDLRDYLTRMAGAVCAVITVHRPVRGTPGLACAACAVRFPCATRTAITHAVFPGGDTGTGRDVPPTVRWYPL